MLNHKNNLVCTIFYILQQRNYVDFINLTKHQETVGAGRRPRELVVRRCLFGDTTVTKIDKAVSRNYAR